MLKNIGTIDTTEASARMCFDCHGVGFRKVAGNPKAEALQRNIAFIQESIATGGLSTIASH